MRTSLSCRFWAVLLIVTAVAGSPVAASEAEKLLPAETDLLLTVNVRQFLNDHQKTEVVRRFLEPWQLALRDDANQLRKYHHDHDLLKTAGITEQDFLDRARLVKSIGDALGVDPLQDVHRITCAVKLGGDGSLALVVEGKFDEAKLRPALRRFTKEVFGAVKTTRVGAVELWQLPDGVNVALLNSRTWVIVRGEKWTAGVLARAAGEKNGGLSPGTRALLAAGEQEHVSLLMNNFDVILNQAVKSLTDETGKVFDLKKDAIAQLVVSQVTTFARQYGNEITAASVGLSAGEDALRLQWGLVTKKPETARELRSLIDGGTLWAALVLKAADTELTQGLAGILARQRVVVKDATLAVRSVVPYEFLQQVATASSSSLHPYVERAARYVTSIPLWAPPSPPPTGALEVEVVRDVAYRDDAQADPIRHRLDLFVPKGKKDFPVVVLVHGGGWVLGDNRCCGLYSSVGHFLASRGIGAVLPNYRLSPWVKHPDHVKDVARAVRWTRDHVGEYGGNPGRLFLLGHSAGGHLVSLLATDESYLKAEGMKSADIRGVVTFSGVYHIPSGAEEFFLGGTGTHSFRPDQVYPLRGDDSLPELPPLGIPVWEDAFGSAFGGDAKERAAASPLTHVRRGLSPFLILTAAHDLPTLPGMADEFHQALMRQGCDARLLKVARRNHNSLMFSAIGDDDTAARAMLEFLKQHDRKAKE